MSTPPPPPPPSSPFGSQPPQQQYGAPPSAYAAPPGYTPGGAPSVQSSKGLGTAMIILYVLTTAAGGLLAFAFFNRKGVVEDILKFNATQKDLDSADALLGGAVVLQWLGLLVSAILTCLWAKRIADNAKARGVSVSSGLAAGGWFIPIGWFFVGFGELRKSVNGVGGTAKSLTLWQIGFIAAIISLGFNYNNDDVIIGSEGALDELSRQGTVGLISFIVFLLATVFAIRAAKEINTAVSGS